MISSTPIATINAIPHAESLELSYLDLPTFLRTFKMRSSQIMWFLGAGASRSAGIKTADDMIWDFKRELYCSQKKLPPSSIVDIGDPIIRQKLQTHLDEQGKFPPLGAESEYSVYFETTYPSPKDRRAYLDALIAKGKPSFGHIALSLLMQEGLCHALWTTNFDRTIEDAAAKILGTTGRLIVADLGEPVKLKQAWDQSRWPLYAKLHGDYQSEQIKNTNAELRSQDTKMRQSLIQACQGRGLAVVGYSGRDASVMDALTEALTDGKGFPAGLFWFKRASETPYPGVIELLIRAKSLGIEAYFVETESFDELLSDIVGFIPETAKKALTIREAERPRIIVTPPRQRGAALPVIRTNALPITSFPSTCRLVRCKIGGWEAIETAIKQAGVDIEARRIKAGVIAFGKDVDIQRVFETYEIEAVETHAISPSRLEKETGERSLICSSLFRALGQRPGLTLERRDRSYYLIPDPSIVPTKNFGKGKYPHIDRICGTVPGTEISWTEACGLRIDYRLNTLWLLIEPRVLLNVSADAQKAQIDRAKDFVRERLARRRNQASNDILDGWIRLIAGTDTNLRLRSFGISDGHDAEFELTRISGFSGRAGR